MMEGDFVANFDSTEFVADEKLSVSVCYDYLHCEGGAEFSMLHLAELLGATLYVAFCNTRVLKNGRDYNVTVQALGSAPSPLMSHLRGAGILKSLLIFMTARLRGEQQVVIFSGTQALVAASRSSSSAFQIYYCHTPPRYAYDLHHWWLQKLPYWQRPLFRVITRVIRRQYQRSLARVDVVLANSKNVQQRLDRYLNVKSTVIYPPVNVATYRWIGQENYYLSMARLEDYKRVDAIVQAFIHMPDKKLIVMSGGSQLDALRKVAANNPNISFTGWVSHSEKLRLIGNALATIYVPIDEDFGVSPVESMAAGKPVIGVREGGLLETVTHLESGYLLESAPTNCNIKDAVAFMTAKRAEEMRLNCEKQAGLFSAETFDQKIMRIVCKRGLDTEKAAGVSDAK